MNALNEQLSYLRLWLGIMVVTGISLVGWLLTNLDAAPWYLLIGGMVALMSIAFACWALHFKIESKIAEISEP
ncbi:MAG: hypothetical protein WBL23_07540 [Salinisphaera sp.]|uniref:hypothetical protein n=1 Tax=Salinisphaera sp. TaxID=1914330 RepID=UPI003C7C54DB